MDNNIQIETTIIYGRYRQDGYEPGLLSINGHIVPTMKWTFVPEIFNQEVMYDRRTK